MNIGLAQISSYPGNIEQNLEKHLHWITAAAQCSCDLVVFPEMSLTGYLTKRANIFAMEAPLATIDSIRKLSRLCEKLGIDAIVGLPLKMDGLLYISQCVIKRDTTLLHYHKQFLHQDEEPYFARGTKPSVLQFKRHDIAQAICYESFLEQHITNAWHINTFDLYLSSVAKSAKSLDQAHQWLQQKAIQYRIMTAIVNATGATDDFMNGGRSAVWGASGETIGKLDNKEEGLLSFMLE